MTVRDSYVLIVTTSDHVRLAATCTGSPAPVATVVYVHSLASDRHFWTPVVAAVRERLGDRVTQIAYDQRGHGISGRPPRAQITTGADLAGDLDAVLAHTRGPVVLVAHSTAALFVPVYAATRPDRVAGLVLFNTAATLLGFSCLPACVHSWPHHLARLRRRLSVIGVLGEAVVARRVCRAVRRLGLSTRRAPDPRVVTDMLTGWQHTTVTAPLAQRLRGVVSVVLAGDRDPNVSPQHAVRLADTLWADYDLVPGARHCLPRTHPGRAAAAIAAVVAALGPPHHHPGSTLSTIGPAGS